MVLPVVTPENYYSPEMNMAYMGSTQFKAFERCEAAALAELKGEYSPPSSAALLVGGYIDAWFSGELPLYQAQHPEIFKRDGTLKAEYVKATEVVARLQADDLYSLLMSGKKQVIRTGTIAGVPFKVVDIKYDNSGRHYTVELQTASQYLGDVTQYQEQIAELESAAAEKDSTITAQASTIQSQESQIESQTATIQEQATTIQELREAGTAAELETGLDAAYEEGVNSVE